MSHSRSEITVDPLRPEDHADSHITDISQPTLGPIGWARWAWRQLTSMRTALVLLLLLAIGAVPGSLFPQRGADPNGVIQWERNNPDAFDMVDALGLFDVYQAPWFSAIYLLLFTSLIGCVIPRARHHAKALRSQPPRTPVRLSRLPDYDTLDLPYDPASPEAAEEAVAEAARQLRRAGYRVQRYDSRDLVSVSAERGYLRETGNLIFHIALIGVLLAVGIGGGFAYTGQRVVVEGTTFVNALSDYSSFDPGRFIDGSSLAPYSLTLDDFGVTYQLPGQPGAGQAGDFTADVAIRGNAAPDRTATVRVNYPVEIAGDRIFLLGNGYAPTVTIRNADGDVIYSESQPFLPQDATMTSLGVIKIPDGLPEQLGLVGFLYPTQGTLPSGAYTSVYPDLINPVMTFNVFSGDLGIDDGTPRSVYTLDVGGLTQLTGGDSAEESLELSPGQTADLPNGWGTVTWEIADGADPVKRFASLQIQNDPSAPWVLGFSLLATLGAIAGLFVPRRRIWVSARTSPGGVHIEYAGLARGEDPTLGRAVEQIRQDHARALLGARTPGVTE